MLKVTVAVDRKESKKWMMPNGIAAWPAGVYQNDKGAIVIKPTAGAYPIYIASFGQMWAVEENAQVGDDDERGEETNTFQPIPAGTVLNITIHCDDVREIGG